MADTKWMSSPSAGTFADGVGIDIFSKPGTVMASPQISTESGTTIKDLCNWAFLSSDTNSYWWGDNGYVYQRTPGSVYTAKARFVVVNFNAATSFARRDTITGNVTSGKVYLVGAIDTKTFIAKVVSGTMTSADNACTTDGAGGGSGTGALLNELPVSITGAAEFNGKFYWTTSTNQSLSVADDYLNEMAIAGNWGSDINSTAGWPKKLNQSMWHPMCVQSIYLFIGNGVELASVDDTMIFTSSGTASVTLPDMPTGNEINSIISFGEDILLGVGFRSSGGSSYETGTIRRWDLSSSTYTDIKNVPDNGVYAMVFWENTVIVFAGLRGNIYSFDGTNLTKIKVLPHNSSAAVGNYDLAVINPGSVCVFDGKVAFALASQQSSSNDKTFHAGIYVLGRVANGYPLALVCAYYHVDDDILALEGRQFGALLPTLYGTEGSQAPLLLSASWYPTPLYEIGFTDVNNLLDGAYLVIFIKGDSEKTKTFLEYGIGYDSDQAPYNTGIFTFDNNYTGDITLNDIQGPLSQFEIAKYEGQYKINCRTIRLGIIFHPETKNPVSIAMDSFYAKWNEEEKL